MRISDWSSDVCSSDLGAVLRQVVQEVVDEDRLAGTDLAGDDDEALRLAQAEAEIGQRPALRQAPIVEAEIRRPVEGIFPQLEEVGVCHLLPWLSIGWLFSVCANS